MDTNVTSPAPGDKSEGCFNCGGGKKEILTARTSYGALCSKCFELPAKELSSKNYNSRAQ